MTHDVAVDHVRMPDALLRSRRRRLRDLAPGEAAWALPGALLVDWEHYAWIDLSSAVQPRRPFRADQLILVRREKDGFAVAVAQTCTDGWQCAVRVHPGYAPVVALAYGDDADEVVADWYEHLVPHYASLALW